MSDDPESTEGKKDASRMSENEGDTPDEDGIFIQKELIPENFPQLIEVEDNSDGDSNLSKKVKNLSGYVVFFSKSD